MRKHTLDANHLTNQLLSHGFANLSESSNKESIELFCQIIELAKTNRLQPIPCDFTKKDYKAKLSPGDILSLNNTS